MWMILFTLKRGHHKIKQFRKKIYHMPIICHIHS